MVQQASSNSCINLYNLIDFFPIFIFSLFNFNTSAMKEEFLHYLWKYSLYNTDNLRDNDNEKIIVIHPGEYNRDSGPDFFNARLIIGGTEWAGNVEIHIKSSHFNNHGHESDPAFDNVILHVVAENDRRVFNSKGEELLTTELTYDTGLYDKYLNLVNNPYIIACQHEIKIIDSMLIRSWVNALVIERLEEKSNQIMKIFSETGSDWEETFYRVLTRYFGFRVNTEPFEMLATSLPFRIIRKHADNRFQVEALLFGAAGLLQEGLFRDAVSDDYYTALLREYKILAAKYSLQSLHGYIWKFSRLRPANFPTIRLSQLAEMLSAADGLFSRVLEARGINQLKDLFEVTASEYWDEHFVFGKHCRCYPKTTGSQATDIFLINAAIPSVFVYGKTHGSEIICERALSFLEQMAPEENTVIAEWRSAGVEADSAFETQGFLQLRNAYCKKRRCLECRIGVKLISTGKSLKHADELILEP